MKILDLLFGTQTASAWPATVADNLSIGAQASSQTTAELVEEIHNQFNGAANKLLADAQAVLAGTDTHSIEKGLRLKAAGFASTKQAVQTEKAAQQAREAKEQQALLMDYALRYPTNRFITRAMVDAIAAKYNLVVGDTSAFTGFVPEKNLREIEAFVGRFDKNDAPVAAIRIKEWSFPSVNKEQIEWVKGFRPNLTFNADSAMLSLVTTVVRTPFGGAHFNSYERIDTSARLICAPAKDMDTSKLAQLNGHFFKAKQVHVPDPVVLQPVKGGYLIVSAWGDEASDPMVANSQNN